MWNYIELCLLEEFYLKVSHEMCFSCIGILSVYNYSVSAWYGDHTLRIYLLTLNKYFRHFFVYKKWNVYQYKKKFPIIHLRNFQAIKKTLSCWASHQHVEVVKKLKEVHILQFKSGCLCCHGNASIMLNFHYCWSLMPRLQLMLSV